MSNNNKGQKGLNHPLDEKANVKLDDVTLPTNPEGAEDQKGLNNPELPTNPEGTEDQKGSANNPYTDPPEKLEETKKEESSSKETETETETETDLDESEEPTIVYAVKSSKVNVRKGPHKDYAILDVLSKGFQLKISAITDGWGLIYTTTDVVGYIMMEFLEEV